MLKFPKEKIRPVSATLGLGMLEKPAIAVRFDVFEFSSEASSGRRAVLFDTELRADFIPLPTIDFSQLAGKTFNFPVNPVEGYIDASVYFENAHIPVDITQLVFGELSRARLPLQIVSNWLMSYEGTGFQDFDLTFEVSLGE